MEINQKILSDITVFLKYSKHDPALNRREVWEELVDRNKQMHLKKYPNLSEEIETAYKFVYDKKILPSMRSMQFAGKPIEISPNRIYNCAFAPVVLLMTLDSICVSASQYSSFSFTDASCCKNNLFLFN